jgi:hypothetical protein
MTRPSCGGPLTLFGKFLTCPEHGPVQAAHEIASNALPDILALDRLPSILALPPREYHSEANAVLKLWAACDVVELTLRLAVSLGLADLARGGKLPPELLAELQPRIEEPTLGKWRGMAQAIIKHPSAEGAVFPELRDLAEETLVPLLDGSAPKRTPETSLSA